MELYKKLLEDFMQSHEQLRANYIKELKSLPPGRLIGTKYKDRFQYYQWKKTDDGCIRRGIGKNKQLVAKLARKEYLKKALPLLEADIVTLQTAMNKYIAFNPESIISGMSNVYKSLPQSYFTDKPVMCDSLHKWMNEPFDQSDYNLQEKTQITTRGLKVRTKSELLIAEMLHSYNIAFRYEQRIYIGGHRYAPDFTIKLADGRIVYWEHCGMTHDALYMHRHYEKLRRYQSADIVPWQNLIVTYDDENGKINLQIVESEIKNKLLVQ